MTVRTHRAHHQRRNTIQIPTLSNASNIFNRIDEVSIHETPQALHDAPRRSVHRVVDILEDIQEEPLPTGYEQHLTLKTKKKKIFVWKMTYFFYVHLSIFLINSLLGGLIIYLVENYSTLKNQAMTVSFIDAWFVSTTCVCSCGLTTIDFARLSKASQCILMFLTFISGLTISCLPALIIKTRSHKKTTSFEINNDTEEELPTVRTNRLALIPDHVQERLKLLPTPVQLRHRAYVSCILLILSTCLAIYLVAFVAIGGWLATKYKEEQLLQDNIAINPWYASFIITLTGFNQNGMTPFSTGFSRFVDDVFLNIVVMMLVLFGTSLFPFILRSMIGFIRWLVPWQHKVVFDYILINNHRLSTLLFPAVQTRIYLVVTLLLFFMGIGTSLILDLNRGPFLQFSPGTRVMIFCFHTINARFAGFNTVDMNSFTISTLIVYLALMATKPQMLCSLDEKPFEMSWLSVKSSNENHSLNNEMDVRISSISNSNNNVNNPTVTVQETNAELPIQSIQQFLRRQSLATKDLARQIYTSGSNRLTKRQQNRHLTVLRIRLFLVHFVRAMIKHIFSFITLTRTWLLIFIFLICAIESNRFGPHDSNFTVFRIVFEIISAFGTVGLSLGYPDISSSFSSILSPVSKVIILLTMLMGRHRGLLASMKDQEINEHSAGDLLNNYRNQLIRQYQQESLELIERHPT